MDDDLRQLLETLRQENAAAHARAQQRSDEAATQMRRHFDIVAEDLLHALRLVAEGVALVTEKIDRLDARVDQIATDLDRRVTRLEAAPSRQ